MVPRTPAAALALTLALLAAAGSARAQEGRAPALEAGAMRTYPRFSNPGGPPAAVGVWRITSDGAPNYSQSFPDYFVAWFRMGGQTVFQVGNYTSWQCLPELGPGAYVAVVESRIIPVGGGPKERETHCEVGQVDIKGGWYAFATSTSECPTKFAGNPTFLNLTAVPPLPGEQRRAGGELRSAGGGVLARASRACQRLPCRYPPANCTG
ncbi:hypothetical protein ABPG75_001858 [Micractinium tetrahymenae]